jgi:hypothetical protein
MAEILEVIRADGHPEHFLNHWQEIGPGAKHRWAAAGRRQLAEEEPDWLRAADAITRVLRLAGWDFRAGLELSFRHHK